MKLIRFDAFTLALEEVFPLLSKHGSAESFDSEGWLYINPEMTIGVQGYRYRYDNFAISEQLILPEGTPY
ncbi:hypothetical protein, partial [Streptobacillus moniliformis]|uniref:hypothetical protein n=1 Tax=Streptobacillus moniliformis TaxID=34105 RepID=UPI0012DB3D48